MKKQVMAIVLRSVVNVLDLRAVFRIAQKMLEAFVLRVRENIPLVIGVKLVPKGRNIGLDNGLTDGDLVFRAVSSKI